MSASRNEATGDVLANVKGSSDAYEKGYDQIDWSKKAGDEPECAECCGACMDCPR